MLKDEHVVALVAAILAAPDNGPNSENAIALAIAILGQAREALRAIHGDTHGE